MTIRNYRITIDIEFYEDNMPLLDQAVVSHLISDTASDVEHFVLSADAPDLLDAFDLTDAEITESPINVVVDWEARFCREDT